MANTYNYEDANANLYTPQGASEEARKILKEELDYFHAGEGDEFIVETIGLITSQLSIFFYNFDRAM